MSAKINISHNNKEELQQIIELLKPIIKKTGKTTKTANCQYYHTYIFIKPLQK